MLFMCVAVAVAVAVVVLVEQRPGSSPDIWSTGSTSLTQAGCLAVQLCYILFKNIQKLLNVKVSFYPAQYPILRIAQSALRFTSQTINQTLSQLLWEASSHMLQLMHKGCSYTYPPLSITRYSFIQLSEVVK